VIEGPFPGLRMGIKISSLQKENSVFSLHIRLYTERRKPLEAGEM